MPESAAEHFPGKIPARWTVRQPMLLGSWPKILLLKNMQINVKLGLLTTLELESRYSSVWIHSELLIERREQLKNMPKACWICRQRESSMGWICVGLFIAKLRPTDILVSLVCLGRKYSSF